MEVLEAIWAPLATVLVALVGILGAWITVKVKSKGTVETSEAADLWKANSEFRDMLIAEARQRAAEVKELREETKECHEAHAIMEARVAQLERENIRLKRLVGEPL